MRHRRRRGLLIMLLVSRARVVKTSSSVAMVMMNILASERLRLQP